VKSLHGTTLNDPSDYFTEGTTTVADYQKVINDAIKNHVDIIFQAGFDLDAVRLAHALGNASRANPNDSYLAHLKILAGDGVDTDAATLVHGSLSGQAVLNALASLGRGNIPPYQGVSGRILFDAQGNPIDKAVVVLDVETSGSNGPNVIKLLQVAGRFN